MRRNCIAAGTAVFVFLFAGCGSSSHLPATLKPQSFAPNASARATSSTSSAASPATQPAKNSSAVAIDDSQVSALIPTTRPATRPVVGASTGTYMYIGTVVAEVNSAIRKQIEYDKNLELQYAAAQRNTTDEELQRAKYLAGIWRQREITKAGGSEAVARRLSLDKDGIDFDEKVKEQFQTYMILIYFQGRLEPLVQVSGDDMRRFYDQNVGEMFTEKAGVKFRAIYVSAKQRGGRDAALKIAEDILQRARRGDDFVKLAREENNDPIRRDNDGWWIATKVKKDDVELVEPHWVEKGSLRLEQVEKAAYALEVGEISQPVDVGEGFYILKLEQKQNGRVRPFDEPDVQFEIHRRLKAEQVNALRQKEFARLNEQSVVREDKEKIQTTINMAMQKYFAWSRANGLTRANPEPVGGTSR